MAFTSIVSSSIVGDGIATEIVTGGSQSVISGGIIESAVIGSAGRQFISSGGSASQTMISLGGLQYVVGGSADGTTVNTGGTQTVVRGTASGTVLLFDSTKHLPLGGSQLVSLEGVASGTVISRYGTQTVLGKAFDTVAYVSGLQVISSGGSAVRTTVSSGGGIMVMGSAVIADVNILSGGVLGFLDNNVTFTGSNTQIAAGTVSNNSSAYASAGKIYNWVASPGALTFGSGITVCDLSAADSLAAVTLTAGATAERTRLSGGGLTVTGGTKAYDTLLAAGSLTVLSGGEASGTVISSSGWLLVSSGGRAYDTQLTSGVTQVIVSGWGEYIGTVISKQAQQWITSSGVVSASVVKAGGTLSAFSGGLARDCVVDQYGMLLLGYHGQIDGVTVRSGGTVTVWNYAQASGSLVLGGRLTVSSGTLTGSDATLAFALADRTASDGYMVNSLALLSNFDYAVTVSATQAAGEYCLAAAGAGKATGYFSVGNGTGNYGMITVGGELLEYGNRQYSLINRGDALYFSVVKLPDPVVWYLSNTVVGSGEIAKSLTVGAGQAQDRMVVGNYGLASATTVSSGGLLEVAAGAAALMTQIAAGGVMTVAEGALADTASIAAGGSMTLADGSYISGSIVVAGQLTVDGEVNASSGEVVFDLAGAAPAKTPLIWGVGYLADADFALTVSGSMTTGVYTLAAGASGLYDDFSVTVGDGMANYGQLDFADDLLYGGKTYALLRQNDQLLLKIADTTGKLAPVITANQFEWIDKVRVFTVAVDPEAVKTEYSLNQGKSWFDCSGTISASVNGRILVRSTFADKSVTSAGIDVNTFDRIAPAKPQIAASTLAPTNQPVILTASVAADGGSPIHLEYSFDGKKFLRYGDGGVSVTANGTVTFRAADAAGNIGQAVSYRVDNIDVTPPDAPELSVNVDGGGKVISRQVKVTANFSARDASAVEYSIDDGQHWLKYSPREGVIATHGETVLVRSRDRAGNLSSVSSCDTSQNLDDRWDWVTTASAVTDNFSGSLSKLDPGDFYQVTVTTAGFYSFAMSELSAGAKLTVYQLPNRSKAVTVLKSVTAKANRNGDVGDVEIANLLLDRGTYYFSVSGNNPTDYRVGITSDLFTSANMAKDDDWRQLDTVSPLADNGRVVDWVGYGDNVDYRKISLNASGVYDLTLDGVMNPTQLTVYVKETDKKGRSSLKVLKSVKVSSELLRDGNVAGTGVLAGLLMDASKEYFVSVEALRAAKGKNSSYHLSLSAEEVFDNPANSINNNEWNAPGVTTLDLSKGITGEWVGYGDAVDCFKFSLAAGERREYRFTLEADDPKAATMLLYQVSGKMSPLRISKSGAYLLAGGDYVLKIASTDNGAGVKNTGYSLAVS